MLTPDQIDEFDQKGFTCLPGAFSAVEASEMEDVLWEALNRLYGADRADSSTWQIDHVSGLQSLKTHPAFDAIGSPAVEKAIDELLGKDCWQKPVQWGQFLVNFPKDDNWSVPAGWHTDFDFTVPSGVLQGVLVFAFLADVHAQGGGTAILRSSHRLMQQFLEQQPSKFRAKMKTVRKAFMESDPWLNDLGSETDRSDRIQQFMKSPHEIGNISLQVEELTGQAGDVVLGHPWLLHAAAPNCGNYPRFMRVQRVRRKEA